jgi:hypothetical protein
LPLSDFSDAISFSLQGKVKYNCLQFMKPLILLKHLSLCFGFGHFLLNLLTVTLHIIQTSRVLTERGKVKMQFEKKKRNTLETNPICCAGCFQEPNQTPFP